MKETGIVIIDNGEKDFQINFPFEDSYYFRPIEFKAGFDEDINEYQYYIKDLVFNDIIETGWLSTDDKILAKVMSIHTLYNFFEKQSIPLMENMKNLRMCLETFRKKEEE